MSDGMAETTHRSEKSGARIVKPVHGLRTAEPDPRHEVELAGHLRQTMPREQLLALFAEHAGRAGPLDIMLRRVCLRALAKSVGAGLNIQKNVSFIHPETVEIGDAVFIGEQTIIQGRFDGRCAIGNHVWIGPQSYFDARDLVIEDFVGWGPGARVLGSEHVGLTRSVPVIQSDLRIAPVHICEDADIGMNAIILPGVTVGRGAIVGAGAVVTRDVEPFSIVAGNPAKIIGWRME